MAFGFLAVKGPQGISAAVKISYHSLFLGFSVRATIGGATINKWAIEICYFLFVSDHRDIGGHTVYAHLVQHSGHVQLEFVTHPGSHFARPVSSRVRLGHRVRTQTDGCQFLESRFV